MKQINRVIKINKRCPFLGNYFGLDVKQKSIPIDFIKQFSNVCPQLKENAKKSAQNQNVQQKSTAEPSVPCGSKDQCLVCPRNSMFLQGSTLQEIPKEIIEESARKCPFVGILNIDSNKDVQEQNLSKKNQEKETNNTSANHLGDESIISNLEDYDKQCQTAIQGLKKGGNYRTFNHIKRIAGRFPLAMYTDSQTQETKEITVWCSNDYLGMGQNPAVKQALIDAVKETGVGAGGTRNIGGSSVYHIKLEQEIADLHHKENSIVMSSGFVANQGAINAITKVLKDVVYLSDEKNHASIIEGIRNCRADKVIWKHNDMADLEMKLREEPYDRNKIIIFESVYSMSGSISPIADIVKLAKKYNALTFIDEVHSIGLYGPRGGGVAEQLGLMQDIDIFSGTLGKAYGCVGGYIAANGLIIDCIRSFAQNFIFSTSIPPCISNAAAVSIAYVKQHNELRVKIHEVTRNIKKKCAEKKIPVLPNESHIIPIFIGDALRAKAASDLLMKKYSIYVQPINYPTVPRGQELLRVSPTPNHTEEMVDRLVTALEGVFEELKLREHFQREIEMKFQIAEEGKKDNNIPLAEQILNV